MKADIEITFSNDVQENGSVRFRPGEALQGRVTITPRKDIPCEHVYLRLLWHTKGRGDRFEQKIAEEDIFQGVLQKDVPLRREFTFTLPKEPWSYTGKLLSIVWGVEVQVDVPRARDLTEKATFILHPYGAGAAK
ncbi:MAG: hypothetical protein D6770_06925 [Anaerolineae bacterium]|nr:MAG: hypothetical protein D6770_06925 [Anaerolineae bacterium]